MTFWVTHFSDVVQLAFIAIMFWLGLLLHMWLWYEL